MLPFPLKLQKSILGPIWGDGDLGQINFTQFSAFMLLRLHAKNQ